MGRFHAIFGAAVLVGVAALTTHASAMCPKNQSFFGTIQRVNGNMLTVSTNQGHWADIRIQPEARVNTNGTAMRPGTFVGAYGCVEPGGVFDATEVTLSASHANYNESLVGTVERVASDRLTVRERDGNYGTWFVPDADRFRRGQQISGVGMVGASGVFYPQTINGESIAFEPTAVREPETHNTITLTGIVRIVHPGSLVVWEPTHGTTGTWIVSDSNRFHVGQRLIARGTEDRSGRFYPTNINNR